MRIHAGETALQFNFYALVIRLINWFYFLSNGVDGYIKCASGDRFV